MVGEGEGGDPDAAAMMDEDDEPQDEECEGGEVGSTLTLERVAAAEQFVENHYKAQMKHIHERKQRRMVLERKIASSDVPEEEQMNLLKDLERKETDGIYATEGT